MAEAKSGVAISIPSVGTPLTSAHFDWFDLSRYEGTDRMPLEKWHRLLMSRKSVLDAIEDRGPMEEEQRSALEILNAPLRVPLGWAVDGDDSNCLVRDLTALDIREIGEFVSRHPSLTPVVEELARWAQWHAEQADYSAEFDSTWIDRPLRETFEDLVGEEESSQALIAVQTDAPDEFILEDFRRWLKQKRQYDERKPKSLAVGRRDGPSQWAQFKVLPYIDLMIFCGLARASLTQAIVGQLLFPGEPVDTTERVRKTVMPLADHLLNPTFLASLGEIAARQRGPSADEP